MHDIMTKYYQLGYSCYFEAFPISVAKKVCFGKKLLAVNNAGTSFTAWPCHSKSDSARIRARGKLGRNVDVVPFSSDALLPGLGSYAGVVSSRTKSCSQSRLLIDG